ncbi:MAG: hypothetical protein AAB034_05425, partial [Nitrospirota bacterium]
MEVAIVNSHAALKRAGKGTMAVLWLLLIGIGAGSVSAYDVMDVSHGGSIEGVVRLEGGIPEPKGFNLITFPDPAYCGRISNGRGWRLLRDFVVSPEAGLKDAIVLLEGVEA